MTNTRGPGGGRKPKPTALKLLEGNLGRHPLNENEPKPAVLQNYPAPDWLSAESRAVWEMLAPELAAIGLLTVIDLTVFSRYCDAWGRWKRVRDFLHEKGESYPVTAERYLPVEGEVTKSGRQRYARRTVKIGSRPFPEVHVYNNLNNLLLRLESEIGMTPSARTRIHVMLNNPGGQYPSPKDPFDYDD